MKWRNAFRRTSIILTLYAIGLLEAYYLPRYGLEWLLAAVGATVLLASFWIRSPGISQYRHGFHVTTRGKEAIHG